MDRTETRKWIYEKYRHNFSDFKFLKWVKRFRKVGYSSFLNEYFTIEIEGRVLDFSMEMIDLSCGIWGSYQFELFLNKIDGKRHRVKLASSFYHNLWDVFERAREYEPERACEIEEI